MIRRALIAGAVALAVAPGVAQALPEVSQFRALNTNAGCATSGYFLACWHNGWRQGTVLGPTGTPPHVTSGLPVVSLPREPVLRPGRRVLLAGGLYLCRGLTKRPGFHCVFRMPEYSRHVIATPAGLRAFERGR